MYKTAISLAVSGLLGFSGTALSQDAEENGSDPNQAIELCSRMSSAELRIACLEAAVEAAYRESPHARSSVPSPERPVSTAGQTEQQEERSGIFSRVFGNTSSQDQAEVQADTQVEGLGAEQVIARNTTRSTYESTARSITSDIVRADIHGYASLEVTLSNGQVWRQLQGDNRRIDPDDIRGDTVEIFEARLGGYQLRFSSINRTIRVRRIR